MALDFGTVVEWLLSLRQPGGGRYCTLASSSRLINPFAPNTRTGYSIVPLFNAYCNIIVNTKYDPDIRPGVFIIVKYHNGLPLINNNTSGLITGEGFNSWLEVTAKNPIVVTVQNISGMVQRFEEMYQILSVQTQADLDVLHGLVNKFGGLL